MGGRGKGEFGPPDVFAPHFVENPGTLAKKHPYIAEHSDTHLKIVAGFDLNSFKVVAKADIAEAAGNADFCPSALASRAYSSAPGWCLTPEHCKAHPVRHSFSFSAHKKVQDTVLAWRHKPKPGFR